MLIGLLTYAFAIAIFFLISPSIKVAAKWFLILAASAAVAWSTLPTKLKVAGVAAVLLIGAWNYTEMMTFIDFRFDEHRSFYLRHLAMLTGGILGLLVLTRPAENAAKGLEVLHPRVAHDGDDGRAGAEPLGQSQGGDDVGAG
jgi:hypothetical protein